MSYFLTFRDTFNQFLSHPTWDTLILLFFFFSVFVYGLTFGRNRIIVLLLASYPAALINEHIPYPKNFLNNLNAAQMIFLKSFGFLVLTFFIFWIFKKSGFSRKELNKKTSQVLLLSFLNVGLWANIIFGYVLNFNAELIKLASLNLLLFGSSFSNFIWLVLPILFLYWFLKN